jgi:hypothetical protein
MRIVVNYKPRHHSYDQDWLLAFQKMGAELSTEMKFGDLTIFHHSWTAQKVDVPKPQRNGKVLVMYVNEFKCIPERKQFAKAVGGTIASQLLLDDAKSLYGSDDVISIPHALNPDGFLPYEGPRKYQIGVRGALYKLADKSRNNICSPSLWAGLSSDIELGKIHPAEEWKKYLRQWKVMPSCEGGQPGGKIMTPRHFEAIGTLTGLVMYPGRYNDILDESHYIQLNRNHSNLDEVKDRIRGDVMPMVKMAREYLADCHTHQHRIEKIKQWALATG